MLLSEVYLDFYFSMLLYNISFMLCLLADSVYLKTSKYDLYYSDNNVHHSGWYAQIVVSSLQCLLLYNVFFTMSDATQWRNYFFIDLFNT